MAKSKYGDLFKSILNEELIAHKIIKLIEDGKIPRSVEVRNDPHDSLADDYFHPSSHCAPGERQLFFRLHPEHRKHLEYKKRTSTDFLTPYMGTMVHAVIQQMLVEQGLCKPEDIEVPLVDEENHWRGHMDLIYKGIPVDIKTMNPVSFDRTKEPPEHYKQQLNCYMDKYPDAPYGVLLMIQMGYPFKIKELRVDRDPVMMENLYQKWANVREAIALNEVPRSFCCPLSGTTFERCGARAFCPTFKEDNV
jgi:hypothetical protein